MKREEYIEQYPRSVRMSGDPEKAIHAYLIKDYSNMKLEGGIQGCLSNPPSPTSDSSAVQLAGTAGGFACWEWVSSNVHIYTISHCRDAIRKKNKTGLPHHGIAVPPPPRSQPSLAHSSSSNQKAGLFTWWRDLSSCSLSYSQINKALPTSRFGSTGTRVWLFPHIYLTHST